MPLTVPSSPTPDRARPPERFAGPPTADIETSLADAPLVTAWREFVDARTYPFTIPGHKGRASLVSATLGRLLGADVPLYGGLDTPKLERHALESAESRAAEFWGANWCRFSTGGSTHANQALCLAVARPGATVLISRTAHRSMLMGLMLAGLRPVWLPVEIDARYGITTGVTANSVQAAVRDHPAASALLLVEPGYTGVTSPDLKASIEVAHAAGLTVVVDQAWGAHFGAHDAYPRGALDLGADAVVMSAHKTLPAISQAAVVLARGERLDPAWLDRCFDACATTSPSGAILASIDAARAILQSPPGRDLLGALAACVARARDRLRAAGFVVPGPEDFPAGCFDPAKLVIQMGDTGCSGLDLERGLARQGMPVEMADAATLVPIVGLFDDAATVGALVDALVALAADVRGARPRAHSTWSLPAPADPIPAMDPRDAFFAARRPVPLPDALGLVCAELVAPYPPGVPVLLPGERISAASLSTLRSAIAAGSRIAYAADPQLRTILVVDEPGATT